VSAATEKKALAAALCESVDAAIAEVAMNPAFVDFSMQEMLRIVAGYVVMRQSGATQHQAFDAMWKVVRR
jgi:hypothetical protein